MGFQMRLWSCVPRWPQMPPPQFPQVQILRRRHAHLSLKPGVGETESHREKRE